MTQVASLLVAAGIALLPASGLAIEPDSLWDVYVLRAEAPAQLWDDPTGSAILTFGLWTNERPDLYVSAVAGQGRAARRGDNFLCVGGAAAPPRATQPDVSDPLAKDGEPRTKPEPVPRCFRRNRLEATWSRGRGLILEAVSARQLLTFFEVSLWDYDFPSPSDLVGRCRIALSAAAFGTSPLRHPGCGPAADAPGWVSLQLAIRPHRSAAEREHEPD